MKRVAWLLAVVAVPSLARAGGFEFPDNGTEALGRAGAFVAKSDNPSALYHNPAGLARLRGTQLQLDLNVVLHDRTFTRAGNYPGDPADPNTPWAGQPYPTISNQGPPQIAPFFAITTDFGKLDRWTFGIGIFGPSSYGKRSYPTTVTVNGREAPNPGRYDVQAADLLLIYPTLSAGVRVTKWFDLGVALHLVVGHFDLSNTNFADLGRGLCPYVEYSRCDAGNHLVTTGVTATASLGMKFTPIRAVQIGINLRGPTEVVSNGTIDVTPPAAMPIVFEQERVTFTNKLPWVLRAGVRYAFIKDGFEHGDVEVNGVYEAWQDAQGDGSKIHVPQLGFLVTDLRTTVIHNYRDTFGVRVGGSYNARLPKGVFTVRLGFAFDSAATRLPETRLDFNSGAKYIPTIGLGYKVRGVAINIAYAYMFEPDRTVTNGTIRPINPFGACPTTDECTTTNFDAERKLLPAVNNGTYTARNMTLSAGITIDWDEALKKQRVIHYE
jgi:long-subunit fatty acid transport protein